MLPFKSIGKNLWTGVNFFFPSKLESFIIELLRFFRTSKLKNFSIKVLKELIECPILKS